MKKSGKLAFHVVNSNIANDSLPMLQVSLGIIMLFEKIYDEEPILTVISNIGEDTIPLFQLSGNYVKSVTQPDTVLLLVNKYWFQMTETRLAEQF